MKSITYWLVLLAIVPAGLQGQSLVNLARPDANIIVGIRASALAASPLVQAFWAEARATKPELDQLVSSMGPNPLTLLDEILITADVQGSSDAETEGLILVRGDFEEQQVLDALCQKGCETEMYQGYEIRKGLGQKESPDHFAMLGRGQVALGSLAEVRGVTKRLASGAAPRFSAGMSEWIRRLGHHHIWIAAAGPFPQPEVNGENAAEQMFANFADKIDGFGLGVDVTHEVDMSLDLRATSEEYAQQFYQLVNGFVAMAKANEQKPDAKRFLENLRLTQNGHVVAASIRIPEAEIRRQLAQRRTEQAQAGREDGDRGPTWTSEPPPKRRSGGIRIYGLGEEPIEVPTTKPEEGE